MTRPRRAAHASEPFRPAPEALATAEKMVMRSVRARLDEAAATVAEELASAGIDSLLLRGPVFAAALYDADEVRRYTDCDVLVPPDRHADAEAVLAAAGYSPTERDQALSVEGWHALTWTRDSDGATVDLHRTLTGATAPPAQVWETLSGSATTMTIGGREVRVPSRAGIGLAVALHVAEHGPRWTKPEEDLRRAVARLSQDEWAAAAEMARRIDAGGAMRAGLARVAGGPDLADALGLPIPGTEARLRAGAGQGMAINLERLATADGLAAKASVLRRALWPSPSAMRMRHPIAQRGTWGLVLAYLVRPFVLLRKFPRNLREWLAVRWVKRR